MGVLARMLEEIDWAEPVLPMPTDPQWAAELVSTLGSAAPCQMMAAQSPWIRRTLQQVIQARFLPATPEQVWLVILVTSQENACRYCYGAARGTLRLMGLDEARIDAVERDVKLAGSDPRERAILAYARKLSRSSPRPVRDDVAVLVDLGCEEELVNELAAAVVLSCFLNRCATFLAVPLVGPEPEAPSPGLLGRVRGAIKRRLEPRYPVPIAPGPPPEPGGPFGDLVELLSGSESARILDRALRGAFESRVLPFRTKAWIFAVTARALSCSMCEAGSRSMLEDEGFEPDRITSVIDSLGGPELDETEKILLPWVRETVHYQTEAIQRKTHELAKRIDPMVLLEAVGVASLANACARLSMLEQ